MYEDYEDEEFEMQNEMSEEMSQEERSWANEMYNNIIDNIVKQNYEAITKNGIDIIGMKFYNLDPITTLQLKDTLRFMIKHFIESEDYEKCTVLNNYLEEIKNDI